MQSTQTDRFTPRNGTKPLKQADNLVGSATVLLLMISSTIGICFAAIGTGLGLIFLDFTKGIGIGILCFGIGTVYSVMFGARRIMKSIGKGLVETIKQTH